MESVFRFKQFSVRHDQCTHKVGTDAVLLGAWANVSAVRTILDVGTGSGVLALMMAQRTAEEVTIDAIEPAQSDFVQATDNVKNSPWSARIKVYQGSIQHYDSNKKYDLIISNPPFFNNSLVPPSEERKRVRHSVSLPYHELLKAVQRLLVDNGTFSVILPTAEGQQFQALALEFGLSCHRRLAFFTRKEKPQERWLLEFRKPSPITSTETLILYSAANQWSEKYRALTSDFYLAG